MFFGTCVSRWKAFEASLPFSFPIYVGEIETTVVKAFERSHTTAAFCYYKCGVYALHFCKFMIWFLTEYVKAYWSFLDVSFFFFYIGRLWSFPFYWYILYYPVTCHRIAWDAKQYMVSQNHFFYFKRKMSKMKKRKKKIL